MNEIPDEIKSHGSIVKIVFHNFLYVKFFFK